MRVHPTRGLTLVELVITTGILVSGILMVTSLIISSQRLTMLSSQRSEARDALHARLGRLRAEFRDAAPSATQFERILAQNGATENVTLSSHPLPALITIETFPGVTPNTADEGATNAGLASLGITNVDLDANGSSADGEIPTDELRILGVRIRIEWRAADWRPGEPLQVQELGALLY
ncbi:MAG: hypothetical protein KDD82_07040 [Planctomycetes bacterium]|nr:hypothetical protein [Planctomycetota bacterium]